MIMMSSNILSFKHHLTLLYVRAHYACKHLAFKPLTHLRLKSLCTIIKQVLSDGIIYKKFNSFALQYHKFTNYTKDHYELFHSLIQGSISPNIDLSKS